MKAIKEFIKGLFEDMANGYSYDRYGNRLDNKQSIFSDGVQGFGPDK